MKPRSLVLGTVVLAASLLASGGAQAQLFRAYLSPTGSDANPCTLPAPCRLLPAALSAVAAGGEIWMLDSANYNTAPVAITKSVTILAVPGALGSVIATGGNAVNIATPGVKVALRNLVIVPLPGGGGMDGVNMTAGDGLAIENCLFANLTGLAAVTVSANAAVTIADTTIRGGLNRGVSLSGGAKATISRTRVSNHNSEGILLIGNVASTTTTADIADSTLDGNYSGVAAYSDDLTAIVKVSVRDGRLVRNAVYGVVGQSGNGATVSVSASGNVISNNGYGIVSTNAGARAWAAGNTVSENVYGLVNSGGAIFETAGNNAVRNNSGSNKSGTITVIAME